MPNQAELFAATTQAARPDGLLYRPDFLSRDEEAALLDVIARLPLQAARYKDYTARRRVASFGGRFDYARNVLRPGPPLPEALLPLRAKAADWLGIEGKALADALVAEYAPGTPLGWHRDVPEFEIVVGISLAGPARMRFRRYPPIEPRKADVLNLDLTPRSAYVLRGEARWQWQHSVAPTAALRYSITLRTRRADPRRSGRRDEQVPLTP